jgi:hypothetical protein
MSFGRWYKSSIRWWILGGVVVLLLAWVVIALVMAPPRVQMIYYSQVKRKFVDKQSLLSQYVKQYGRDAALARQFFEGPLGYYPEVWFLEARVLGVWAVTPSKPKHLIINMSGELVRDIEKHPLLVQRWIEGLFETLRANGSGIEKCSFLIEGEYRSLMVGSWNLAFPLVVKRK